MRDTISLKSLVVSFLLSRSDSFFGSVTLRNTVLRVRLYAALLLTKNMTQDQMIQAIISVKKISGIEKNKKYELHYTLKHRKNVRNT